MLGWLREFGRFQCQSSRRCVVHGTTNPTGLPVWQTALIPKMFVPVPQHAVISRMRTSYMRNWNTWSPILCSHMICFNRKSHHTCFVERGAVGGRGAESRLHVDVHVPWGPGICCNRLMTAGLLLVPGQTPSLPPSFPPSPCPVKRR